jgi:hypothetical protein
MEVRMETRNFARASVSFAIPITTSQSYDGRQAGRQARQVGTCFSCCGDGDGDGDGGADGADRVRETENKNLKE